MSRTPVAPPGGEDAVAAEKQPAAAARNGGNPDERGAMANPEGSGRLRKDETGGSGNTRHPTREGRRPDDARRRRGGNRVAVHVARAGAAADAGAAQDGRGLTPGERALQVGDGERVVRGRAEQRRGDDALARIRIGRTHRVVELGRRRRSFPATAVARDQADDKDESRQQDAAVIMSDGQGYLGAVSARYTRLPRWVPRSLVETTIRQFDLGTGTRGRELTWIDASPRAWDEAITRWRKTRESAIPRIDVEDDGPQPRRPKLTELGKGLVEKMKAEARRAGRPTWAPAPA